VSLVGRRTRGTERLIQWSTTVPCCEGRGCTWLEDPAHCPPFAGDLLLPSAFRRQRVSLVLPFSLFLYFSSRDRRSVILLKLFPTISDRMLIWFVCSLNSFKKSKLGKIRFSFNISRLIDRTNVTQLAMSVLNSILFL